MFVVAYVNCAENKVAVLDTKDNVTEEIAAKDFCSLVLSGAITVENAMVTDNAEVLHILAPDMNDKNTFEIDVALPNDGESIKQTGILWIKLRVLCLRCPLSRLRSYLCTMCLTLPISG